MGLIDHLTWDQYVFLIRWCVWVMVCSVVRECSWTHVWRGWLTLQPKPHEVSFDKGLIHFIELWSTAIWLYCELIACEWALDGVRYDTWAFPAHLGFFFAGSSVSLVGLFLLCRSGINLHSKSNTFGEPQLPLAKACCNGVLMMKLGYRFSVLNLRENECFYIFFFQVKFKLFIYYRFFLEKTTAKIVLLRINTTVVTQSGVSLLCLCFLL